MRVCLLVCSMVIGFGCDNNSDNNSEINKKEEPVPVEMEQRWRLTAIIEDGNALSIRENFLGLCFLSLKGDGTLEGYTGVNTLKGTYKADATTGKFSLNFVQTELAAIDDETDEFERLHTQRLSKVTSYVSSKDKLELYYDNNSFLKYQSIEVEKK